MGKRHYAASHIGVQWKNYMCITLFLNTSANNLSNFTKFAHYRHIELFFTWMWVEVDWVMLQDKRQAPPLQSLIRLTSTAVLIVSISDHKPTNAHFIKAILQPHYNHNNLVHKLDLYLYDFRKVADDRSVRMTAGDRSNLLAEDPQSCKASQWRMWALPFHDGRYFTVFQQTHTH